MLGFREMSDKSSNTTVDTFKEILCDISDLCEIRLENNGISQGKNVLCDIRNFMSDRAQINIFFIELLIDCRKKIMHEIVEAWDCLSGNARMSCSQVNNFFCGFHLLVHFAECTYPILN